MPRARALIVLVSCLAACGSSEPLPKLTADPPSSGAAAPADDAPKVPEGMVLVAGATFKMGSDRGEPNEGPAHDVTLGSFYIDKLEATVAEYRACQDRGACVPPGEGEFCNGLRPERDKHPINCIDQASASAYCQFRKKRLPTEEEWELAARGTDGRIYPWGNAEPNQDLLCWKRLKEKLGTCEVGAHPAGASPVGALDMAGNVWEWTSSAHCGYRSKCDTSELVGRGGSWDYSNPANVTTTARAGGPPGHKRDLLGVRCVKDLTPPAGGAAPAASARP